MTEYEAIERGKEIASHSIWKWAAYAPKIYEILGYTNSRYIGHSKLSHIRHDENMGEKRIYYQYVCHKLVKCSFKQALITPDYKNYKIFIYSDAWEDKTKDGEVVMKISTPYVTVIDKEPCRKRRRTSNWK